MLLSMSWSTRLESLALGFLNPLAFALRNRIRHRRAGYRERPSARPLSVAAAELLRRNGLESLVDRCEDWTLDSNLYVLDLLEQSLSRFLPARGGVTSVLDVGCKNFEYAPGLLAAFAPFTADRSRLRLTGIELDAYRVYSSLHSRADAAEYFLGLARDLGFTGDHRFLAGDVLDHHDRYDCVTWFSPFLTLYPLLRWGLARDQLRPAALIRHVVARVAPGGLLVVVNQEPEEDEIQRALFRDLGIEAESFVVTSKFPRKYPQCFVHCVRG
jgi:SAM-dependent methyltransferase